MMTLEQVQEKRQKRMEQATGGIVEYVEALDDYELNLLSWMESAASSTDFEGWVLYQFSRAVSCFRSCKHLIASGSNTDALALSRTIQDIYILVQWVAMDPQVRLKQATVDEVLKQRVYDAKRMLKHTDAHVQNLQDGDRKMLEDLAMQDPRKMPGLPSSLLTLKIH